MEGIWGEHEIPVGGQYVVQVGALHLTVERTTFSWSIAWQYSPNSITSGPTPRVLDKNERSFAFHRSSGTLKVVPLLADRPVVVRPIHDIAVAPGDMVQFYVTTSLWVGLRAGEQELLEFAGVKPKETWFGPNTVKGELCYAGRLPLCHDATDFLDLPHRAITPLLIHNRSTEPLGVVRLRLPVPRLPLHRGEDGRFWTSQVAVHCMGDSEVEVEVVPHAPAEAGPALLVSPARDQSKPGVVSRAFNSVFNNPLIA